MANAKQTAKAAVGDPIRAHCTKCKRPTRHWVVALVEGSPARVQCTECDGIHNYRAPKPVARAARSAPRRRATTPAKAEALAQEFDEAVAGRDSAAAIAYRMDARFKADQLLQHTTFGLGLVSRVIPPNKIRVLFQDGERTLRCAG